MAQGKLVVVLVDSEHDIFHCPEFKARIRLNAEDKWDAVAEREFFPWQIDFGDSVIPDVLPPREYPYEAISQRA